MFPVAKFPWIPTPSTRVAPVVRAAAGGNFSRSISTSHGSPRAIPTTTTLPGAVFANTKQAAVGVVFAARVVHPRPRRAGKRARVWRSDVQASRREVCTTSRRSHCIGRRLWGQGPPDRPISSHQGITGIPRVVIWSTSASPMRSGVSRNRCVSGGMSWLERKCAIAGPGASWRLCK